MNIAKSRMRQEKCCTVCLTWLPIKYFYKYAYITNQGKRSIRAQSQCKSCSRVSRRKRRLVKGMLTPEQRLAANISSKRYRAKNRASVKPELIAKVCGGCRQLKARREYFSKASAPDGYYTRCRQCTTSERKLKAERDGQNQRRTHLKASRVRAYGMTIEEYERLHLRQENKCAACGELSGATLCIDHDHTTGKVRGLLCKRCNWVLGHVKESIPILLGLQNYIAERCIRDAP